MVAGSAYSGNGVGHINKVKLRRAQLVGLLGLVTTIGGSTVQFRYFPGNSGPLSLVIPPSVGDTSTGDGFGHNWEETASYA